MFFLSSIAPILPYIPIIIISLLFVGKISSTDSFNEPNLENKIIVVNNPVDKVHNAINYYEHIASINSEEIVNNYFDSKKTYPLKSDFFISDNFQESSLGRAPPYFSFI